MSKKTLRRISMIVRTDAGIKYIHSLLKIDFCQRFYSCISQRLGKHPEVILRLSVTSHHTAAGPAARRIQWPMLPPHRPSPRFSLPARPLRPSSPLLFLPPGATNLSPSTVHLSPLPSPSPPLPTPALPPVHSPMVHQQALRSSSRLSRRRVPLSHRCAPTSRRHGSAST